MTDFPERRTSPLARQLVLLAGFVALVIVAIFTVLIPELSEDDAPQKTPGETGPTSSD